MNADAVALALGYKPQYKIGRSSSWRFGLGDLCRRSVHCRRFALESMNLANDIKKFDFRWRSGILGRTKKFITQSRMN